MRTRSKVSVSFQECRHLLTSTAEGWINDKAPMHGAALAFYSMLSIGPLLLLVLAVASVIFGHDAARGRIVSEIQDMLGEQGAQAIQDMITDAAANRPTGAFASMAGIATLLFGASGAFGALQEAMNTIWKVKAKTHHGWRRILRERFLSFSMVFGTGFLLLISLVISTALSALHDWSVGYMTGFTPLIEFLNFAVSFGIISFLFCLIFKYIPDVYVAWRDVIIGGILTAFLFTVGKAAIAFYLGHSSFNSSYGAAGSLVAVLVWVYYSAQILFFGAEFCKVYAQQESNKRSRTK